MVYKWYILPIRLYATYHLLREPRNSIDGTTTVLKTLGRWFAKHLPVCKRIKTRNDEVMRTFHSSRMMGKRHIPKKPSMGRTVYLPTWITWMVNIYGKCREIYQSMDPVGYEAITVLAVHLVHFQVAKSKDDEKNHQSSFQRNPQNTKKHHRSS